MDWQAVKQAICDGRRFTVGPTGARLLSDTLMPSGHVIFVHLVSRHDRLTLHDGGAAFDELATQGLEAKGLRGVRDFLAPTGYKVSDEGLISIDGVEISGVSEAIMGIADASLRAAHFLLAHSHRLPNVKLDRQVKDALKFRYPSGQTDFRFEGRFRQHKFDFGLDTGSETILVDAVSPDIGSIGQAVLKSLDAKRAEGRHARPILVYDASAHWPSDLMNMLSMGGEAMSFERIGSEKFPLAA